MSQSPYTEGWPRLFLEYFDDYEEDHGQLDNEPDVKRMKLVPLSDAERLRGALIPFAKLADKADSLRHLPDSTCEWRIAKADLDRARAALNPERDQ